MKLTSLLRWCVFAIYHSLVMFFVVYFTFANESATAGRTLDIHSFGAILMTMCILVVTGKFILESVYWTFMNHLAVWGSLVIYFAARYIISYMFVLVPAQFGLAPFLFQTPQFYLCCVLGVVACLLPDFTAKQ